MHKSLKEATICMVVWIETDLKSRTPHGSAEQNHHWRISS